MRDPRRPKGYPRNPKKEPKGTQGRPKRDPRGRKRTQGDPRGDPRGPRAGPNAPHQLTTQKKKTKSFKSVQLSAKTSSQHKKTAEKSPA